MRACATMPHPKIALTGQAREIRKNRLKKVEQYKQYKTLKKARKDADGAGSWAPAAHDTTPWEPAGDAAKSGGASEQRAPWRNADGTRAGREDKRKKAPKVSALAAARAGWERSQADVVAARDEARAAKEARIAAQQAALKRRAEQASKLNKRTKKGQPVLGNQIDMMLAKLEGR